MGFKIVDGPTSDVKFEARGKTLDRLFESAAMAVSSVMCSIRKVEARRGVDVEVDGSDTQDLLFNWLNRVIAIVDIEGMFFSKFKVGVSAGGRSLRATCFGEEARPEHSLTVVKSVTYHDFSLKGDEKDGWKATAVLDI